MIIWGIVWFPERESDPVWYDTKAEAVEEYNHRSDKHWTAELV